MTETTDGTEEKQEPLEKFIGACDYCGWRGPERLSEKEAHHDKRHHSQNDCPVKRTGGRRP